MVTWNLAHIKTKVRALAGMPEEDQLSDAQLLDHINTYYVYTMPFELKEQVNLQPYTFNTLPNQATYSLPATLQTDQPMAYANGYPLVFYQDRDIFFQDWPQQYTQDQVGSGNAVQTAFPGTTQAFPVISGTFLITDGSQVLSDPTGSGILTGNGTGTINYVTGVYTATFTAAPAASVVVYNNYQAYQPARPQGVLLYNSQFTFRPIPDQVYAITLQGFITQVGLTGAADLPLQTEWGQLIAYGAALEIFSDLGDTVGYNNLYPVFKRFENVALGRYVEQFSAVQSVPRF